MFARMGMRALVRAPSRRYFADGRSSYTTRFRKYELPKQAGIVFGTLGVVGGTFKFIYDDKEQERKREEDKKEQERKREEESLPFAERAAVASMLKPFKVEAIESKLQTKALSELWVALCGGIWSGQIPPHREGHIFRPHR